MAKGSFVFYETFLETANKLEQINKDYAYEFLIALAKYGLYGEVYEGNPVIEAVLVQGQVNIDMAKERYQKSIENGRQGGRPRKVDYGEVARLHKEGKTNKEIAAIFNVKEDSIRKIIKNQLNYTQQQKNQKNLNENDNDDVNNNVNDDENNNDNDDENNNGFGATETGAVDNIIDF